jgi:hypothetical protein
LVITSPSPLEHRIGADAENPIEIVAAEHPRFAQQESAPLAHAGGGGLRWGEGMGNMATAVGQGLRVMLGGLRAG